MACVSQNVHVPAFDLQSMYMNVHSLVTSVLKFTQPSLYFLYEFIHESLVLNCVLSLLPFLDCADGVALLSEHVTVFEAVYL